MLILATAVTATDSSRSSKYEYYSNRIRMREWWQRCSCQGDVSKTSANCRCKYENSPITGYRKHINKETFNIPNSARRKWWVWNVSHWPFLFFYLALQRGLSDSKTMATWEWGRWFKTHVHFVFTFSFDIKRGGI